LGHSPKSNWLLKPVGAETVNTVSLLAAVCDTLSAAYDLFFCRSVRMSFFYPCPHLRRRCFAHSPKKRSSQNHIPFSRSFSCNRRFGQQKSRYIQMVCTDRK